MAESSESDAVSDTYHVALTILGARAMQNAMTLWMEEVPVVARSHTAMVKWYGQAIRLITLAAQQSETLAYKYIRLNRALNVGTTIATPDDPSTDPVQLDDLRKDFIDTVKEFAPAALKANPVAEVVPDDTTSSDSEESEPEATIPKEETKTTTHTKAKGSKVSAKGSEAPQKGSDTSSGTDGPQGFDSASGGRYKPYTGKAKDYGTEAPVEVEVEHIPTLAEIKAAQRKALLDEAETVLQASTARLEKQQAGVTDTKEATEIHAKVGSAVALHSDRMVMNGGRATEMNYGNADKKVMAFARVHEPHGDTYPCGFCAMLLSRGAVYKSKRSAGNGVSELSQYHNGDHCRAEAVYSKKQFNESARFNLNRKFAKLWRDSEQGKLPKDYGFTGLKEFRRQVRDLADRESATPNTDSGRIR